MAYATLGAPIPISQFLRSRPGVAQMTPGFVVPAAPVPGARTGPSNEDVLRRVFGSVERGRAMQAASAAEARQREVEEMQRIPRVNIAPPEPPMLAPHDVRPSRPAAAPLVPADDEGESEGDIIEDIAENEEEAIEVDEGSEFSGWGCGMGERPVGVTGTRREVARMDHIRKRQRGMRRKGLSQRTPPKAMMPVTPPRPGRFFNVMGVLKARKRNPFIKPGR